MGMETSILHRVDDAFDDRNAFLLVALGAISLMHRLKAVLACYGNIEESSGEGADGDPEFLYMVLGLVALSRRAMNYVEWLREPRETRTQRQVGSGAVTRDVREILE
jgi:hypothetical protein